MEKRYEAGGAFDWLLRAMTAARAFIDIGLPYWEALRLDAKDPQDSRSAVVKACFQIDRILYTCPTYPR